MFIFSILVPTLYFLIRCLCIYFSIQESIIESTILLLMWLLGRYVLSLLWILLFMKLKIKIKF